MSQIILDVSRDTISLSEITEKHLIVYVAKSNKQVSFLRRCYGENGELIFRFKLMRPSCSDNTGFFSKANFSNVKEVLQSKLESGFEGFHAFSSLKDFAEAVIKNDWKL